MTARATVKRGFAGSGIAAARTVEAMHTAVCDVGKAMNSQQRIITEPLPPDTPRASAAAIEEFRANMHLFDAKRYEWLAHKLREAELQYYAALCEKWALEHRTVSATLRRQAGL